MSATRKHKKYAWREPREVIETEMTRMSGKLNHTFIKRKWKTRDERKH